MRKNQKRFLSVLLSLVMVLTVLPLNTLAFSAEDDLSSSIGDFAQETIALDSSEDFSKEEKASDTASLQLDVPEKVGVGSQIQIPIILIGTNLGALDFELTYDQTKLRYVSCDPFFDVVCSVNGNNAGKVIACAVSLDGVSPGTLFVMTFDVVASESCTTDLVLNVTSAGLADYDTTAIDLPGGSWTLQIVDRFTVTYNANGGSGAPASQSKTYGTPLTLSNTVPVKTGYTFLGWATEENATVAEYAAGDAYANEADVTLYAVWKANTYTVAYNANGGRGTMAASIHTYDATQELNTNGFTRQGYNFLGWATDASAVAPTYTDSQTVKNLTSINDETVTLYAVWEKKPIAVTSISIETAPTKRAYVQNESLDTNGLTICVAYSDDSYAYLDSDFTVSAPDMSLPGEKSVTVAYEGQTTNFSVYVYAPEDVGTLRMENIKAPAGRQVKIPVYLDNAELGTLTYTVQFDATKLAYVSYSDAAFDMVSVGSEKSGEITIANIANATVTEDQVIVLTFDVLATENCFTNLNITVQESTAADDMDTPRLVTGGQWTLQIAKFVLGDVNDDGRITAVDARWNLQVASGARKIDAVQSVAADVNGDGKVNAVDARWILQVASGARTL